MLLFQISSFWASTFLLFQNACAFSPLSRHPTNTALSASSFSINTDLLNLPPVYDDFVLDETAPSVNNYNQQAAPDVVDDNTLDRSDVEIEDSSRFQEPQDPDVARNAMKEYPFAMMMQGSAPFIARHAGETAVFHLPGELFDTKHADSIISDISLARLLGMKVVLVVGCRYDSDSCSMDFENPAECHNFLKVTDESALRRLEEEAGFLRTEVERKLNRCLRMHGGVSVHNEGGNVVSGNFFTAQMFGLVRGEDFQYTGFTKTVHSTSVEKILKNNDIVLLTTVGTTALGELVNVNGYHLAASVASALGAYKLIYFSNEGSVLCDKKDDNNANSKPIQEVPLSFARAITKQHGLSVYRTGFATFKNPTQQNKLSSRAIEMLLHLGWASWALEHGVTRAHVVNPSDGALLEELFTTKNGANTCLYHDREDAERLKRIQAEREEFEDLTGDWDKYFQKRSIRGQRVAKFG